MSVYPGMNLKATKVYVLEENAGVADRMAFNIYLVALGHSSDLNVGHWQSYVATCVCSAFPEIRDDLVPADIHDVSYQFETVDHRFLSALLESFHRLFDSEAPHVGSVPLPKSHDSLPDEGNLYVDADLVDSCTVTTFRLYCELLLTYGLSNISPQDREEYMLRRGTAIMHKHDVPYGQAIITGGRSFPLANYEVLRQAVTVGHVLGRVSKSKFPDLV